MNNIVLLGGMGVGKDFMLNSILDNYKLNKIVTDTTRPIREGEVDGETYNFITNDEFEKNLRLGKYIEHQTYKTVHGIWYYGTSKDSIKKDNTIIILDKDGYLAYKKLVPNCASFYLSCIDETERFYRSLKRLNSVDMRDVEEVYRRIKVDEEKFKDIHKLVDFVIPQCYNIITVTQLFRVLDKIIV